MAFWVNIWFLLGNIATRDCGPTAAGLAYWSCNHDGRWMTGLPDLSQCQSHWLQKLRGQLDRGANRQASIVHVAHDLAHYTSNFGPLLPGDLLLLIDTIESMTSRMRDDLRTIPTLDQKRAVITQVVQVTKFGTRNDAGTAVEEVAKDTNLRLYNGTRFFVLSILL